MLTYFPCPMYKKLNPKDEFKMNLDMILFYATGQR